MVGLDVGASTGGFTDVLLDRGATRVYALDVGYGQLAERLRQDPRVVSMERVNARTLAPGVLPEPVDLASSTSRSSRCGSCSARSARCSAMAAAPIVALVKPQFEAGRAEAKGGVVRDAAVHRGSSRK